MACTTGGDEPLPPTIPLPNATPSAIGTWFTEVLLNFGKCSANPLAVWQVEPLLKAVASAAFGHFQGLFVVSEC